MALLLLRALRGVAATPAAAAASTTASLAPRFAAAPVFPLHSTHMRENLTG